MHRVVVVTPEGELISDVTLSPDQLAGHVAAFAMINNTGIYIDGRLLQPEQREALLQGMVAQMQQQHAAAPPLPEEVADWNAVLRRGVADLVQGYADLRRAEVQNHQEMHAFMQSVTETHLKMQRELADEAVRQRQLTARSLADIDLMDRAVKTTRLSHAMASAAESFGRPLAAPPASAETTSPARQGYRLTDFFKGFLDFAGGQ